MIFLLCVLVGGIVSVSCTLGKLEQAASSICTCRFCSFADIRLTGEALINKLQERLQDLRDMYHAIRVDQAQLDRRWRKTLEKRRKSSLPLIYIEFTKGRRKEEVNSRLLGWSLLP